MAHCDGDPFDTTSVIEVELIPASFNVVVNAESQGVEASAPNLLLQFLEPFQIWDPLEGLKKKGMELRRLNANLLERLRKL